MEIFHMYKFSELKIIKISDFVSYEFIQTVSCGENFERNVYPLGVVISPILEHQFKLNILFLLIDCDVTEMSPTADSFQNGF